LIPYQNHVTHHNMMTSFSNIQRPFPIAPLRYSRCHAGSPHVTLYGALNLCLKRRSCPGPIIMTSTAFAMQPH